MAQSLIPLRAGMQYQAWLFWEYATKLFEGGSNVVEVSFECPGVRSFDDIVVRHDPPRQESLSDRIQMVHVQAKYHVGPGAFTIAAMTEPAFIGADKVPLLGLLGEAYRRIGAEDYMRRRFWIVSPWPMHPEDKQLLELWRDNTSSFRLDVLRRGTNRSSRWVRLRATWRDALGISNDDELYAILSRLRINASQGDLNGRFANYISAVLRGVGLKGIDPTRADDPYGQIPWGLHAEGETRFTKEKLEAVADQYELWGTGRQQPPPGRRLGVRTAVRWGEQMESTTAAYLPLEEHFDGRFIHDETAWPNLYTTLRVFLRDQVSRGGPHLLEVGAVATIAFAAGYALPAKDGLPVHPIQRRRDGADVWDAAVPDASPGGWTSAHDEVATGGGPDIAVGIGASQVVWDDVKRYVAEHLPGVGRMIELRPATGTGQQSVASPAHALHLAQELASFIRDARRGSPPAVVHLFVAAPNALTFLLGQEGERLGRCQLYEFDFGGERTGSYRPSLLVPDHTR